MKLNRVNLEMYQIFLFGPRGWPPSGSPPLPSFSEKVEITSFERRPAMARDHR
jgi:hypothetical protein